MGWVPAATRMVRAGSTLLAESSTSSLSADRRAPSRSALAWPKSSISTSLGRQALGEADAFLERLGHLLVVQRVARRVDQPAAVGDGRRRPRLASSSTIRGCAALPRGGRALGADGAGVREELVGDLALLRASSRARTAASPRSATSAS